jgi:hypothetical protein
MSGMLRVPQHERKNITGINSPPSVLSVVEGLLGFSSTCQRSMFKVRGELNAEAETLNLEHPLVPSLLHAHPYW